MKFTSDSTLRRQEHVILVKQIWNNYGIVGVFVIIFLTFSLCSNVFLTRENLITVARQVSVLGLISTGVLFCLISGNMDLSVGSFLGFSGAAIAWLSLKYGVFPALLIVFLGSIVIGYIQGYLSTRGKGLSIMVTLSTMSILYGCTLLITQGRPITNLPQSYRFLGAGWVGPIPWPVIVFSLVALVSYFVLSKTIPGLYLYTTGGNPDATRLAGVNVIFYQKLAFMISAFLATIGGLVLIARMNCALPNAGRGEEMNAVGAVLIGGASLRGGIGSIRGTIIGIFILGFISNGLNLLGVNPFYQFIVKGLIILFAILMDQWGRK